MQQWKCCRIIEAMWITSITKKIIGWDLIGEGGPINVEHWWYEKFQPQVGGYFIRDDNRHDSFSPADVFEAMFTKL